MPPVIVIEIHTQTQIQMCVYKHAPSHRYKRSPSPLCRLRAGGATIEATDRRIRAGSTKIHKYSNTHIQIYKYNKKYIQIHKIHKCKHMQGEQSLKPQTTQCKEEVFLLTNIQIKMQIQIHVQTNATPFKAQTSKREQEVVEKLSNKQKFQTQSKTL